MEDRFKIQFLIYKNISHSKFLILFTPPSKYTTFHRLSYLCHMFIKNIVNDFLARLHQQSTIGTLYRLGFFLFLYFIGRYLILFLEESAFFSSLLFLLHQPFLWLIDHVSKGFLGLFYSNLTSSSDYIVSINNIEIIRLLPGCSGLDPIMRITFILLLYPLDWKTKSWLFPLSWFIILFAATIHFILLIPIAYHWPEYYSFSHNWLTRIIFYGFYFLIWLIWEKVGYPKKNNMESGIRDK